MTEVDVAIVGGGMVGASLALALRDTGRSVMLVEGAAPAGSVVQPGFDERTTALGNASRRIFEGLGVWPFIAAQACAIRTIHVSDAGHFGFARLRAAQQGVEAFGYVASNSVIGAALWDSLSKAPDILLRSPARAEELTLATAAANFVVVDEAGGREEVRAHLMVAADGAHSNVRAAAGIDADIEDYQQVAVVANVAADRRHDGTAYERFTRSGPLAVLPLHDGSYGVVWTATPAHAQEILLYSDTAYLEQLQERFGWRAGRFVKVGRRGSYPLKLSRSATVVGIRTVLIGNAAQTLHPVAGQGFNLGLRDAAILAELLASKGVDPGSPELLERFSAWRAEDRSGVIRFTDGLVRLFGNERLPVAVLRNLGLLLFDLSPPAKGALSRVSLGFGGRVPRLARGLAVS